MAMTYDEALRRGNDAPPELGASRIGRLSDLRPEDRARAVAVLAFLDVMILTGEALRHLARDHGSKRHRRDAAGAELARRELVDSDVESPAGGGPEATQKQ